MRIQPVAEGQGEVEAAPAWLRPLLIEVQVTDVEVGGPIHRTCSQLTAEDGVGKVNRVG